MTPKNLIKILRINKMKSPINSVKVKKRTSSSIRKNSFNLIILKIFKIQITFKEVHPIINLKKINSIRSKEIEIKKSTLGRLIQISMKKDMKIKPLVLLKHKMARSLTKSLS